MDLPPGDGPNQRNLRFSYGGNAWAVDGANNRPTYHKQLIGVMSLYGGFTDLGREVTEIKQPSETIMIADAWSLGIGGPYGADYCGDDDPFYLPLTMLNNPYPLRDAISLRHKDGFNAVFVDAHVRWLRQTTRQMWAADPSQVSSYAWACPEKKTR
jgi:prepilin-type processing-associated H-X9-DG protein